MNLAIVAALLLAPDLAADTTLRLVSDGTGDAPVVWYLDGVEVATTRDGQVATIDAPNGRHDLWATTGHEGEWRILARPEPAPGEGVAYVDAWTAHHAEGHEQAAGGLPDWLLPSSLALLGTALLLAPTKQRRDL